MQFMTAGVALIGSLFAVAASAQDTMPGSKLGEASFINSEGEEIGTAALIQTPSGALIQLDLQGVPQGTHGLHIHETGSCETPDFKSAGDHFNPTDHKHGILAEDGPHAGDLPNMHVQSDGVVRNDLFVGNVSLEEDGENTLFPEGGTALVLHEGPDDYKSDPSGHSGSRIACGVIERAAGSQ
jgi:Cu-Zn family superoxide dismutase